MCKYCKKLKEISELDKNEFEKILNAWKRRDLKARKLIADLYLRLQAIGSLSNFKHDEVVDFLGCNYVE